jgi:hypothetical protein
LSVGRFHQHSAEVLEMDMSPVDYIQSKYQQKYPTNRLEEWRAVVGNYGIPKVIIIHICYIFPTHDIFLIDIILYLCHSFCSVLVWR